MMVYPAEMEGGSDSKPIATSTGWSDGKPEVSRRFENVFTGLALGIKYQGTSVQQMGEQLDSSQLRNSRNSFAADHRRPRADQAHGQQGNGARETEVGFRLERIARVAHAPWP